MLIRSSTCVDHLMQWPTPHDMNNTRISLLKTLLEHDLQITRPGLMHVDGLAAAFAAFPFETFVSPLSDESELLETIFTKSEPQLRHVLRQASNLQTLDDDTVAWALTMATMIGWIDGCKAMLEADLMEYLDIHNEGYSPYQTLLRCSVSTGRLDMVRFWLSQRENYDYPQLALIGRIESVLYPDASIVYGSFSMDVVRLLSTQLLHERQEIRLRLQEHDIEYCCENAQTGLPDAHLRCMLTALSSKGFAVPQHFWPSRASLYYVQCAWTVTNLKALECLENVGFCEVGQSNFKCNMKTRCSPLVFLATQQIFRSQERRMAHRDMITRWFLTRGADLKETWPGSDTSALHCLAWQSARYLQQGSCFPHHRLSMEESWNYEEFEFLLKETILDGCECACASPGCNFLSCLWKQMFSDHADSPAFSLICDLAANAKLARKMSRTTSEEFARRSNTQLCSRNFRDLTLWVDRATRNLDLNGLINGFIRLFLFSYLDLRHTCCDIERISNFAHPNYTKQPYPRYPPEELRRITNEDAHLRARLEELVPELVDQHGSFGGDLWDFVINILIPIMRKTAEELKEEDKVLYASGRRELGVIMQAHEHEVEQKDGDAQEEEADQDSDEDGCVPS